MTIHSVKSATPDMDNTTILLTLWIYNPIWMEINKMATLKESAMAYQPPQTLNIADLSRVPVDIEVKDGEGKDKDGEIFKYKYATIDGKDYRIAGSILGGIKAILEKVPNLTHVVVIKQGIGMSTRYQVIPWSPEPEVVTETI